MQSEVESRSAELHSRGVTGVTCQSSSVQGNKLQQRDILKTDNEAPRTLGFGNICGQQRNLNPINI